MRVTYEIKTVQRLTVEADTQHEAELKRRNLELELRSEAHHGEDITVSIPEVILW